MHFMSQMVKTVTLAGNPSLWWSWQSLGWQGKRKPSTVMKPDRRVEKDLRMTAYECVKIRVGTDRYSSWSMS